MADNSPDDLVSAILAISPTAKLSSFPGFRKLHVFWTPERRPRIPEPLQEKIVWALNSLEYYSVFIQFWAPVKTGGRIVLSTSNQPFALSMLRIDYHTCLDKYRLISQNYHYDIDWTNLECEYDPMIISGAAASAFLNRIPELLPDPKVYQRNPLVPCALDCGLKYSVMLPLYNPPRNSCVGVVECSMKSSQQLFNIFHDLNTKLEVRAPEFYHYIS